MVGIVVGKFADERRDSAAYRSRFAWGRLTVCDGEAERRLLLAWASRKTRAALGELCEGWFIVPPHRAALCFLRQFVAGDETSWLSARYYLGRLGWGRERPPGPEEARLLRDRVYALYVRRTLQVRFDQIQELLTRCEELPTIAARLRELAGWIGELERGRDERGTEAEAADASG